MASKTSFFTVGGEVIGELTTGHTRIDYVRDGIGSVVATLDQGRNVKSTARYKPFGDVLSATGTQPAFGWNGTNGFLQGAGVPHSELFAGDRAYGTREGRWCSINSDWSNASQSYGSPALVNPLDICCCCPTDVHAWKVRDYKGVAFTDGCGFSYPDFVGSEIRIQLSWQRHRYAPNPKHQWAACDWSFYEASKETQCTWYKGHGEYCQDDQYLNNCPHVKCSGGACHLLDWPGYGSISYLIANRGRRLRWVKAFCQRFVLQGSCKPGKCNPSKMEKQYQYIMDIEFCSGPHCLAPWGMTVTYTEMKPGDDCECREGYL